jgi:hypothetical protein
MPSPPQGFTVILPGEITQSDLDPQQPPAKLTGWPLTIGKDIPGPNESNYVANDNTGNLLNIVNSDTSSNTLSALKMAIDAITLIRTKGELAINLANGNTWSGSQTFTAGIATNSLNLNGAGDISALVSSFNGRTGAVVPASGDYAIGTTLPGANESNYVANDNTGNLLDIVNSDTSSATLSALKMAIDDITLIRDSGKLAINLANGNTWSGGQTFTAGIATNSLDLNGAGYISALVSSFNGRTGAVVPVSGDYEVGTTLPDANESNYVANDNTGNLLGIVNSDTSSTTLSANKIAIDDSTIIGSDGKLAVNLANENSWSAAQSFTAGLATNTLNLNGAGLISALVSSFNGRTGAVNPASGDYSHQTVIDATSTKINIDPSSSYQLGNITSGPNGIIFWCGSCVTDNPSFGYLGVQIGAKVTYGLGYVQTGTYWATDNLVEAYPVILTGMATGANAVEPNKEYGIYLYNSYSDIITVSSINLSLIGL